MMIFEACFEQSIFSIHEEPSGFAAETVILLRCCCPYSFFITVV